MQQNPYLLILPFLLIGLAVFAVQLGGIYLLLWPFRDESSDPEEEGSGSAESSGAVSPAEAGCLATPRCRAGWNQAFGCLLNLAAGGVVSVEIVSPGNRRVPTQGYQLRLVGNLAARNGHERGLLEVFFLGKQGIAEVVPFDEAARRFPARSARFKRPLLAALRRKQLIDPYLENTLYYLRLLAIFSGLASGITLLLSLWLASFMGAWPVLLVPAGFLAGALVTLLQAGSSSICTRQGRALAEHWLATAASLARAGLPDELESQPAGQQLAYLAALGQLRIWIDSLQPGAPTSLPGWFHTGQLDANQSTRALIDFLAAATELAGGEISSQGMQPEPG